MADLKELGSSGLITYAGTPYDSVLLKLQGPERNMKLRAMIETDDVVGGVLSTFEQLGTSVDAWVEPASDSAKHREQAEWVWDALNDMETPLEDVLADAYTFLGYGFAPLEVVLKVRRGQDSKDGAYRSKYSDNAVAWRKMALRAQTSVDSWELGPNGEILGLRQLVQGDIATGGQSYRTIPVGKMLLFRTSAEKNNPEGRPVVRNAFRTWYRKHHLEEVEAIAAENNLVGVPYIQGPEGMTSFVNADSQAQGEIAHALNMITGIRTGKAQGMFVPHGWGEPKLIASPGAPTVDTDKLVKRYDSRIAISMLAGFVLTGMDKHGSFALSGNQLDIIIVATNAYNKRIASEFNRNAIPRIFRLNGWPTDETPELKFGEPDFSTVEQALETVKTLGGLGSQVPLLAGVQRSLLGRVGLKVDDKEFNELMEEQAEAEEEAEDQEPPFPGGVPGGPLAAQQEKARLAEEARRQERLPFDDGEPEE